MANSVSVTNTVVVQAHPLDDSFSMALFDAVLTGLRSKGADPTTLRISEEAVLETQVFDDVGHLVVVYPTWWGSLPAMLLGPVIDVLAPWVDDGLAHSSSPLRSVERLTVVTTHGSSRLVNRLQGEPGLQLWRRTVLGLCADGASFEWLSLYKLDRLDSAARTQFVERVTEQLAI